ncbi:MAG: glucose-6-phosphate isomerase [Bacilli bacterium]|nr:glucose-6-phosphate isomerase [Bacilli bacterium]
MMKFDLKTYTRIFINQNDWDYYMSIKKEYIDQLNHCEMTGWMREINQELVEDIKITGNWIKNNFDTLVVIGIGGSFLGSFSFDKALRRYFKDDKFEIIYAGTTLSSKYLEELLDYLKNKNYVINVISKSGTTMETTITYKLLKDDLKRRFGENYKDHIIVTTDEEKGSLREEVNKEGYKSFIIPNDIGGRYSFMTPAHLLPLSINYDINIIKEGYYRGKKLIDYAFEYALTRFLLYKNNKYVENFCVYEENLSYFTEWLKQLFGETEGKEGKGIFPTSSIHTRDLHSLGQFIQEGNKILFETFIKIEEEKNYIDYKNRNLHEINNIVEDSVIYAHFKGDVPCMEIILNQLTEETLSELMYFFQLSAAFSALLMEVNPFNQPGVEVYKEEVRKSLNN